MKILRIIILLFVLQISSISFSQSYKSALGLRFGFPSWVGVDFKHNFGSNWAFDAGLGFGDRYLALDLQGLYHFPISAAPGLRLYLGGAIDLGAAFLRGGYYYKDKHGKIHYDDDYYYYGNYYYSSHRTQFVVGLSFLMGIEYTLEKVPLNFSLDFGPRLPISSWFNDDYYYGRWFGRGNFAIRYTFK